MTAHRCALAASIAMLAAVCATATQAQAASCPFTYTNFETIIPHVDSDSCPDSAVDNETFCRATTSADQVHIFYFAGDGDQCLLKVESYDEDKFELTIKK